MQHTMARGDRAWWRIVWALWVAGFLAGCAARGQVEAGARASDVSPAAAAGPVIVDGEAAGDVQRALGWTAHEVWAREPGSLPGVAPLTGIEREIAHAGAGGPVVVLHDGGELVAYEVHDGPGGVRMVLSRWGDLLWVVAPAERDRSGAELMASPMIWERLLRARWQRVARLLGWGTRRAVARAPVYMGRIPAGERAAVVARIRARVAAGRAAAAAEHGAGQAGRATAQGTRGSALGGRAAGASADALQVGRFRLTETVARHATEVVQRGPFKGEIARPFLTSPHTVEQIMAAGRGVADPGGVAGALRWDVPGTFRGTRGTWELVVKDDLILHFNFVAK